MENTHELSKALLGGPLDYDQFRRLFPAVKRFQKYSDIERVMRASSQRLGHRQRESFGSYYYTHTLCPGDPFDTPGQATKRAYKIYLAQFDEGGESGCELSPGKRQALRNVIEYLRESGEQEDYEQRIDADEDAGGHVWEHALKLLPLVGIEDQE